MKKILKEDFNKTETNEIEKIVRSIVSDEVEKKIEKLVRKELEGKAAEKIIIQIIKNAMSSAYKTLWFRRATWLSGIENKEA